MNVKGWQQKRGTVSKRKVIALVERGGRLKSVKVDDLSIPTIRKFLFENIVLDSTIEHGRGAALQGAGREFAKHDAVNHSVEEYVRGQASANTIEGFFSILKRGMVGTYQHCGEQPTKISE